MPLEFSLKINYNETALWIPNLAFFSETLRNSSVFRNVTVNTLFFNSSLFFNFTLKYCCFFFFFYLLPQNFFTLYSPPYPDRGEIQYRGLCSSLANQLASFPTSDLFQGLLQYVCTCFSQDGSQHGGPWEIINTNYGMVTPLLLTPKKPSWACTFGEVPLTSEVTDVVILYLYSSRVQLLVLGVSGKTKFQFTLFDKLQLFCPGDHLLPVSSGPILPCPFCLPNLKHPFLSLQSKFHFVFIVFSQFKSP